MHDAMMARVSIRARRQRMRRRPRRAAAALFLLGALVGAPGLWAQSAQTVAADPGLSLLEQEIGRLAGIADGVVGVAAIHLESGRTVYHNRSVAFPMASTYKVPIPELPPDGEISPSEFRARLDSIPREARAAAADAFDADPRDTATPEGMAALLAKVWRQEALGPENTALLLDIMLRCATGQARIKGMLPPDVEVAHKTGTNGRAAFPSPSPSPSLRPKGAS